METKVHEIGETRKAKVLSIEKYKGSIILVLLDENKEAHIVAGHPKGDFKVHDRGTIKFTKGGPQGGYWHFTPYTEEYIRIMSEGTKGGLDFEY